MMGEKEHNAELVIERVMLAIHDLATRTGATSASVMRALKSEGFTSEEIALGAQRMFGDE